MRRLVSKEEEEKKRKRNQTILVLILAFIMVFSSIGFAIQSNSDNGANGGTGNEIEYNGFNFINQNGFWVLGNFAFQNNPKQVEYLGNLGSEIKPASNYQGKPAYIYVENDGAEIEIMANLGRIALRVQRACPENTYCNDTELPVKTCSDNFIIIKEASNDSIVQENNCVLIEGKQEDLAALADQFLFKILGIR